MRRERSERREKTGNVNMQASQAESSGKRVLDVKGISFAYGDKALVRDFSVRVQRGDRIALVGPNGSGKSTLIKLLLQQIEPQQHGRRARAWIETHARAPEKRVAEHQQEVDVVLHRLVLGHEIKKIVLTDDAAEVVDYLLEFVESAFSVGIGVRLLERIERMVLYLADTLAGDTVAFADSFKRDALGRGTKTESRLQDGARALRKTGEEAFDDSFGLKSGLVGGRFLCRGCHSDVV
jgi:energy-coupling factor transporter ATP-binding protein EcfA2